MIRYIFLFLIIPVTVKSPAPRRNRLEGTGTLLKPTVKVAESFSTHVTAPGSKAKANRLLVMETATDVSLLNVKLDGVIVHALSDFGNTDLEFPQ